MKTLKSPFSSDDLHTLVNEIKREIQLSNINLDPYSFVSPSAYDTAWLAMIEEEDNVGDDEPKPMFQDCLDWILCNQNAREGFWGNSGRYTPVTDAGYKDGEEGMYILTSTLACVVALHKWNIGSFHLHKGKRYIERSTEMVIEKYGNEDRSYPLWFVIKFTGILELAQQRGIHFVFSSRCIKMIQKMFYQRREILKREKMVDDCNQKPLLAYLEVLPTKLYVENHEDIIVKSLDSIDGSLFQSPSATASAFVLTRNTKCLAYLQNLVQRCPNGVPQKYPLNEALIKLSMVNLIESTGIGEFFCRDIEHVLQNVYSYEEEDIERIPINYLADKLHKDSLAFRMLRMHGRDVSPRRFCWFLNDQETRHHLERNIDSFFLVILSVYRATDLMFPGEHELEEAREYTRNLLEKSRSIDERMIKLELSTPWIARLKHLDHRMWIEDKNSNVLSIGKASFLRLHSSYSDKLYHLAARNFEFQQANYRRELEELTMWVKKWGLNDIGFGREKTTYCYFATATSLPYEYAIRVGKLAAKSGILITIADDFFDEEGCLDDLKALTKAILRWEGEELKGHGKIIFRALDDIVRETAETCRKQHGTDITDHLRNIWSETFESWLREAEWSKKGHKVSMEEYIRNGMISIAAHTIALSISCLMEPCFPQHKLQPGNYDNVTKLLMIIPRLLNDLQSYQKEQEQGKINSVLLHMRNHAGIEIEDSITHIEKIIDSKRKEFLEHILVDELSDLPKPCKEIHMSCCKVFEMFFNKKNRFDSDTEMLQDIKKALYDPVNVYEMEPMPLMGHGDEFMILPLILNHSPKILEFKRKGDYGAMKKFMCLRRSYRGHKPIILPHSLSINISLSRLLPRRENRYR
ncbi:(E,E)-geranyllinalool synthase [Cardamine amara subsp. amara]|uniref:(E,E)-geranyllinalool synthase n=1 Tax=Cardamine amara subsp. amara TaxID=228776 RepID=A0ABD1AVK1_CARAN